MGTQGSKKTQLVLLALALIVAACGGDDESTPTGGPNLGGIDGGVLPGGDGGVDVRASGACFSGKPVDNLQHLNACAQGCQAFDNQKRLPGFVPGQPLPALP